MICSRLVSDPTSRHLPCSRPPRWPLMFGSLQHQPCVRPKLKQLCPKEWGNPRRETSALPRLGMCPCWEQDRGSTGCCTFPSSTNPKESQFCCVMSPLNSCTASKGSQGWGGVSCSLCFSFPPCSQTSILLLAIQTITKSPKAFSQPSPPNKPHKRMPQGARKALKSP